MIAATLFVWATPPNPALAQTVSFVARRDFTAGTNPPAGAILDYTLRSVPSQPIELAIYDAKGNLVREFSSAPIPENVRRPEKWPTIADYWMANPQPLPTHVGMNRFIWDFRYEKPIKLESKSRSKREEALAGASGPRAVPGEYEVQLTVGDRVLTREEVYRRVWHGQMTHRDRSVDVFVRKVRGKLALTAPGWVFIHTHFGVGYRFTPEQV